MSGTEALAICERAQCDIVLLDVMMPEMDGFEVCRRLKANPLTHHIPVVMVTALDQPSDRVRGLEAGADDFLTKPVSDIALLARVRSLVRLKMAADELRMRARDLARDRHQRSRDGGAHRDRAQAGACCWSTTARPPTSASPAFSPPSTPSTSSRTRRKRCSMRRRPTTSA